MSEIVREAGEQARPAEAGTAERNNSEIMKLTHTHTNTDKHIKNIVTHGL